MGAEGARDLARSGDLDEALRRLAATPYHARLRGTAGLSQAQRAVSQTLLWHLRVLAGWLPRDGVRMLRPLAAGFETANVAGRFRTERGSAPPAAYELGALATASRALARAAAPGELRAALAASSWGDPGDETAGSVLTTMRLTAAQRTATAVPAARRWAAGRAALVTARERYVHRRRLGETARRAAAAVLGARALEASGYEDFRRALPSAARWAVTDVDTPTDLWRAETHWWHTLGTDGRGMMHTARHDATAVVGAVAVLSADCWAVRAALAVAERGGAREGVPGALV
ncbi:hypothetical protein ACJ6WE_35465 [Streptomyces sp. MMS24-I31]|uniref:hypothetical protein n=1 Tax=Streptomyces sp. MMS24-I31 TaxID=3351563 RepID=UPI003896D198